MRASGYYLEWTHLKSNNAHASDASKAYLEKSVIKRNKGLAYMGDEAKLLYYCRDCNQLHSLYFAGCNETIVVPLEINPLCMLHHKPCATSSF